MPRIWLVEGTPSQRCHNMTCVNVGQFCTLGWSSHSGLPLRTVLFNKCQTHITLDEGNVMRCPFNSQGCLETHMNPGTRVPQRSYCLLASSLEISKSISASKVVSNVASRWQDWLWYNTSDSQPDTMVAMFSIAPGAILVFFLHISNHSL